MLKKLLICVKMNVIFLQKSEGNAFMFFLQKMSKNTLPVLKLLFIGVLIGVLGGLIGAGFHISLECVTDLRIRNPFIILLLPLGGLVISAMYNAFSMKGNIDMKRVFESVKENRDIPSVMIPLMFLGTLITHIFGGSAGREGAALQIGGSMGYNIAKALKQDEETIKIIVTAGMSGVFSALFGTPLTASLFALEVTGMGLFKYRGLLTGVVSSLSAFFIAHLLGVEGVYFNLPKFSGYQADVLVKAFVLAVLCAGVCVFFSLSLHKTEYIMKKYITNSYIRIAFGGLAIVLLTVALKTVDYNGAGMDVIKRAVAGEAKKSAFLLKIVFTSITVASGFKGGEIVPTFFIGSVFGCFAGGLLGLNPALGASLGLIALFSGMTKCPISAFLLALEMFSLKGMPFFAIVTITCYLFSGDFGLYGKKNITGKLFCKNI